MTKQEITNDRDLYFNNWIRYNLKSSERGLVVQDIDFMFYEYNKNKMIISEVKTRNKQMSRSQFSVYKLQDKIYKLAHQNGLIKYQGFYLITFTNTTFEDGNCIITKPFDSEVKLIVPMKGIDYKCRNENEKVITMDQFKKLFSM